MGNEPWLGRQSLQVGELPVVSLSAARLTIPTGVFSQFLLHVYSATASHVDARQRLE